MGYGNKRECLNCGKTFDPYYNKELNCHKCRKELSKLLKV